MYLTWHNSNIVLIQFKKSSWDFIFVFSTPQYSTIPECHVVTPIYIRSGTIRRKQLRGKMAQGKQKFKAQPGGTKKPQKNKGPRKGGTYRVMWLMSCILAISPGLRIYTQKVFATCCGGHAGSNTVQWGDSFCWKTAWELDCQGCGRPLKWNSS